MKVVRVTEYSELTHDFLTPAAGVNDLVKKLVQSINDAYVTYYRLIHPPHTNQAAPIVLAPPPKLP
jgi:hypothetical protein